MSNKFEIIEERKDAPEIPTFEFKIPDEERSSEYEKLILPGLQNQATEVMREEMQRQYYVLMEYLRWMGSMDPIKSNELENDITEKAKNFADCIAKFNAGKIQDEKTADWVKEEQYWHNQFEDAIKSLPIAMDKTMCPEEDSQKRMEVLCDEDHKFFNEFALFVACQKALGRWDGREKVLVEK